MTFKNADELRRISMLNRKLRDYKVAAILYEKLYSKMESVSNAGFMQISYYENMNDKISSCTGGKNFVNKCTQIVNKKLIDDGFNSSFIIVRDLLTFNVNWEYKRRATKTKIENTVDNKDSTKLLIDT